MIRLHIPWSLCYKITQRPQWNQHTVHSTTKAETAHVTPSLKTGGNAGLLLIHLKYPHHICRYSQHLLKSISKYSEVYSVANPGESKPWLSLPPQNLRRVSKAELSAHHTWSPLETELSQNLLRLLSPRNAVISPPKERQYLDSDLPLFMQYLPCD